MIHATYNPSFVVASVLIAMWTSYAAMEVSPRIQFHTGGSRLAWLALAAVCAGGGIWSMHFMAMLSYHPDIQVAYDVGTTALSFLLPILGAAVAFYIVHYGSKPAWSSVIGAGIMFGTTIVTMHYTGMAAMRMAAFQVHDPLFVAAAVVIAITAATVALWVTFYHPNWTMKIVGGVVMGFAIAGMHYTAMMGFSMVRNGTFVAKGENVSVQSIGFVVALVSGVILTVGILAANYDRYRLRNDGR